MRDNKGSHRRHNETDNDEHMFVTTVPSVIIWPEWDPIAVLEETCSNHGTLLRARRRL